MIERRFLLAILAALVVAACGLSIAPYTSPGQVAASATTATLTPTGVTTPSATATPTPPAATSGSLLPAIYYRDGGSIYAVNRDGSSPTLVVTLPLSPTSKALPALLPDGRLLYPSGNGFATIDRFGRPGVARVPDLNPGETVWSVVPAPDGRTLAWQLFAPGQLDSETVNTGVSRIVLTGRFGDAGTTVASAQALSTDGQVPIVLGWRPSSPYGLGGATLLLQYLYSATYLYRYGAAQSGVLPSDERGLLEYDPSIGDVVNDYLPPLALDLPLERAFAISADGSTAVYGDSNVFTPSGEGALAQTLDALNLNTVAATLLDEARNYPHTGEYISRAKVKKKGHTVVQVTRTALHLYQYFSHHAFIAPGDGRVLYTLLTVSYPPGALTPRVQHSVLVATLDGRSRAMIAQDATAEGWLDGHHAIISRPTGLYSIDVVFGGEVKLASGAGLHLIGMRQ